jgi:thioredoxin 1
MSTIHINADQFEKEVLKSKVPVLVDFWATWCPPCRAMEPILEELAGELAGKAKIVKIDIDAVPGNKALAQSYQVRSIPSLKVFKKGKITSELVGFTPKEGLVKAFDL